MSTGTTNVGRTVGTQRVFGINVPRAVESSWQRGRQWGVSSFRDVKHGMPAVLAGGSNVPDWVFPLAGGILLTLAVKFWVTMSRNATRAERREAGLIDARKYFGAEFPSTALRVRAITGLQYVIAHSRNLDERVGATLLLSAVYRNGSAHVHADVVLKKLADDLVEVQRPEEARAVVVVMGIANGLNEGRADLSEYMYRAVDSFARGHLLTYGEKLRYGAVKDWLNDRLGALGVPPEETRFKRVLDAFLRPDMWSYQGGRLDSLDGRPLRDVDMSAVRKEFSALVTASNPEPAPVVKAAAAPAKPVAAVAAAQSAARKPEPARKPAEPVKPMTALERLQAEVDRCDAALKTPPTGPKDKQAARRRVLERNLREAQQALQREQRRAGVVPEPREKQKPRQPKPAPAPSSGSTVAMSPVGSKGSPPQRFGHSVRTGYVRQVAPGVQVIGFSGRD